MFESLSDARVMWDQSTGRSRGYGFIAFRKKNDAERAIIEMHGQLIGSRPIRVNWANQKLVPKSRGTGPPNTNSGTTLDYNTVISQASPNNTTVYVGNLTPDITNQIISNRFKDYGEIEEVRVQPEKGYAFVRYTSHDSACRAIVGMNGETIGVRTIKCSWGKEKIDPFFVGPPPMMNVFPMPYIMMGPPIDMYDPNYMPYYYKG